MSTPFLWQHSNYNGVFGHCLFLTLQGVLLYSETNPTTDVLLGVSTDAMLRVSTDAMLSESLYRCYGERLHRCYAGCLYKILSVEVRRTGKPRRDQKKMLVTKQVLENMGTLLPLQIFCESKVNIKIKFILKKD